MEPQNRRPVSGIVTWVPCRFEEAERMARSERESIASELLDARENEGLRQVATRQVLRTHLPDLEEEPFFDVVATLVAECSLRRERLQMGNNDWHEELHARDLAAWEQLQMDAHDVRVPRQATDTV